jgi:hypothetical protein
MTYKQRVEKFWHWFRQDAVRFHQTIDEGRSPTLAGEVASKANEFLPAFVWVFGRGKNSSEHSFTLSPEGIFAKQFLADFRLGRGLGIGGRVYTLHGCPERLTLNPEPFQRQKIDVEALDPFGAERGPAEAPMESDIEDEEAAAYVGLRNFIRGLAVDSHKVVVQKNRVMVRLTYAI